MPATRGTFCLIASAIVFFLAILMCFGIVIDKATVEEILGTISLGSLLFVVAHLP